MRSERTPCWQTLLPLLALAGMLMFEPVAAGEATAKRPLPVLVDTDFGSWVDDAFALAVVLASEELELRGVTTVGSQAEDRAWMVGRLLTHVGRESISVAFGRGKQPESSLGAQIQYRRHPAVVWDRTAKPLEQPAVEFLYERLKEAPGEVTLLAIGPLTNIAALLKEHPDAARLVREIVITGGALQVGYSGKPPVEAEWNIRSDLPAAQVVFGSGAPLRVVPLDATAGLEFDRKQLAEIFQKCSMLTFQLQCLCQLAQADRAALFDPATVMLALEPDLAQWKKMHLTVTGKGVTRAEPSSKANATVAMGLKDAQIRKEISRRLRSYGERSLPDPPGNRSDAIPLGKLPVRVHAFEDYATDIESRWWLTGIAQSEDCPQGSRRSCRSVLTQDYDARMGNLGTMYAAVVFNPVPGPPMGSNPRLTFRYKLRGTDTLRVQLFSLSRGYHRYLSLTDLPQNTWQTATVDMTAMRRPDGSGDPLGEDERIDDIQFYVDPRAEVLIDSMILYEAARDSEDEPFPRRILFSGWFDTGKQGREWPGDFEIVPHESPGTWDAAKSVKHEQSGRPWLRIHLRGQRPLGDATRLRFSYRADGAEKLTVSARNSRTGAELAAQEVELHKQGRWHRGSLTWQLSDLETPPADPTEKTADKKEKADSRPAVDELIFRLDGGTLLIDDLLLYEPEKEQDK